MSLGALVRWFRDCAAALKSCAGFSVRKIRQYLANSCFLVLWRFICPGLRANFPCVGAGQEDKMMLSQGSVPESSNLSRHGGGSGEHTSMLADDPVTEAALTGAAYVRYLSDARFASLRALRQLLRALDAERAVIGWLGADAGELREELVWSTGFGRCGESERVQAMSAFTGQIQAWLQSTELALSIPIELSSDMWQELPCDRLLLVRGAATGGASPVFAAQMRSGTLLPQGAALAISRLLDEYIRRRPSGDKG
jgi:hypothetical protein